MIQLNDINDAPQACTYKFENPQAATAMARQAQARRCEDITVVRSGDHLKLSFKGTWQDEQALIDFAPEEYGDFRMGSHYSKGECDMIADLFLCWHLPEEVCRRTRRSIKALSAFLEKQNFLPRFPRRSFKIETVIDDDGDETYPFFDKWGTGFLRREGFSKNLILELERLEVLSTFVRTYSSRDARRDEDVEDDFILFYPFDRVTQEELVNVFSYLADLGRWDAISDLCEDVGDEILNLRCHRRLFIDPLKFLLLLETHNGLPWDLLYQRELLRAYRNQTFAMSHPDQLVKWMEAAQLRKTRTYARKMTHFPGAAPFPAQFHENPIAIALYFGDSEGDLARLAMRGNRFAAAVLGDMFRVKSQLSSRFEAEAERWEAVQDGYWPTAEELRTLHAWAFPFDPGYAQKMSHVADYDRRISFAW